MCHFSFAVSTHTVKVSSESESELCCSVWGYGVIPKFAFLSFTKNGCSHFLCTIPLKLTHFVFLSTVITSKDLQKHGNIWVCPISDHVCTRFFFVWVFSHFITLSYYKFCLFWLTMCPTIVCLVCFSSGTRTAR